MRKLQLGYFVMMICLIWMFFACHSSGDRSEERVIQTQPDGQLSYGEAQDTSGNHKTAYRYECIRGQAEPIVKVGSNLLATFELQADSIAGIEAITYANGDKVTIRNWGCEYYVLTFQFETSSYLRDSNDFVFWVHATDSLMRDLLDELDAPINIRNGLEMLKKHVHENENNTGYGDEIDFGEPDIRSFVTLDSIRQLDSGRYGVSVSFAIGPL